MLKILFGKDLIIILIVEAGRHEQKINKYILIDIEFFLRCVIM
ncbi:hypothetical protein P243_1236 [Klebsiella pneumoniae subsp. pneumoniae 1158]|nr:hypothetical protein P243_1236 [Klebsiella pneumoniae subsp. pneumoniae 1158]